MFNILTVGFNSAALIEATCYQTRSPVVHCLFYLIINKSLFTLKVHVCTQDQGVCLSDTWGVMLNYTTQ